ncbi:SUMF1/EgtB/PvdO family nonheme iron enzyme [Thermoanaerobacterium sp. DL9XJH110]|uniref:SUMF1/EgtB/PvdO family nonheme iron enzyme n=1 Tax=Thermoanaerobacterium sp. DL9XJH110 TaxID=3386643 RepID=UPI003BB712F5
MIFSIKDSYRQAVEAASGGKNTVLYDDLGYPSIMTVVPRFKLSDIDPSWPSDPHPAFIVNDRIIDEIFTSKFQNVVVGGRALSLPMQDPKVYVNFDQARGYCTAKGKGWHLMTNAEWAAIALWCWKNGFLPRGNNNYGGDHSATYERGKVVYRYQSGGTWYDGRTATGSGPASWYHDNTPFGIADLNGNVWEWVDGLKLHDGKIYVHGSGGVAMNNFETQNNSHDVTGWVDTGAYFDNTTAGSANQTGADIGGDPILSPDLTNPMYTADPTSDAYYGYSSIAFESLTAESGFTPPAMLKYLAIQPPGTGLGGDSLWVRNYGERLPLRGGFWIDGAGAGVFALDLGRARSLSASNVGFRAAFIPV